MMGRGSWRLALLAVLVMASAACKKKNESKDTSPTETPSAEASRPSSDPKESRNTSKDLVDEGYRFSLRHPGEGWTLMGTEDIRNLSPDAVAGMSHKSGLNGLVIVEHSPAVELEKVAGIIIDSMPIENKSIEFNTPGEYLGHPAMSYKVTGRISDIPMAYEGRIFSRDDYVYQVIAVAPTGVASADEFQTVFDAMVLDAGEIVPPEDTHVVKDTSGVGWRLRDGTFESAISGLRVKPPEGWRVAIGAEASRINPDAEVALVSRSPEAYMIVIPELIGAAKEDTYRDDRVETTKANMGLGVEHSTAKTTLLGREEEMAVLSSSEVPWTFNVGIAFFDEWAMQATGWYNTAYGDDGQRAVRKAMASIELMSPGDKAALVKELSAIPDRQNFVGDTHALRDRVFEEYQRGIRWTAPEGFWQMSVGQAVRSVNPAAQLYARYDNSALHLLIIGEDAGLGLQAADYHSAASQLVSQNLNLKLDTKAAKARFKNAPAVFSEGLTPLAGMGLRYRVYTAIKGSRAVQLHIWGPDASFQRNQAMITAAAKELELLDDLPAVEQSSKHFVDHRLGFRLDGVEGLPYTDNTPLEMRGIASFPSFGVDGVRWIGVLAICALDEGKDEDWFMTFMEQRLRDGYSQFVAGEPQVEDTSFLGQKARHLLWRSQHGRLDAQLFLNGRTLYALISIDRSGGTDIRDRALKAFKLL